MPQVNRGQARGLSLPGGLERYAAPMDNTELAFAGAAEQARMLASGAITAPALTDLYLERIDRLDPELRAYRTVFAD